RANRTPGAAADPGRRSCRRARRCSLRAPARRLVVLLGHQRGAALDDLDHPVGQLALATVLLRLAGDLDLALEARPLELQVSDLQSRLTRWLGRGPHDDAAHRL